MIGLGRSWTGAARLAARYAGFRMAEPRRRRWTRAERLAALPTECLAVSAEVDIRWNDYMVPYVEAATDRDLAVGLGVAHAHLRLFQMELMRRLAWGRLSELVGAVALPVDQSLRIVGFSRSVPEIERMLPTRTRDWLEGFRDGVNAVIETQPEPPEEFRMLGVKPARWTLLDLLAIGRLAASDFSWKVLRRLLPHSRRADWAEAWESLLEEGGPHTPSFAGRGEASGFEAAFACLNRGGSNSLAVSARKSASGGAMIASDPHLGVMLPNLWLIAGMRSPGFRCVGLMVPGVPVVALGRNEHIAWGGTSLHAASSDLFDVSDLPADEIAEREEHIPVRWGRDGRVTVRDTAFGPIITDAPMLGLPQDRPLAMRWIGHDPNDELTAMLDIARAKDWDGFRKAIDGFAAPAQNFVYAGVEGEVGRAVGAHLPRRPPGPPADIVQKREFASHWREIVVGSDFPATYAPERGFVASANNRPPASDVPAGFFFSPDDRVNRVAELLEPREAVTAEDLKALQRDVTMPTALRLRTLLIELIAETAASPPAIAAALGDWDGRHDPDSAGALALELMVYHLLHHLHSEADLSLYLASWDLWALLRRDLEALPRERLQTAIRTALVEAQKDFARHGSWGAIHRLRIEHPFARAPRIGARYRFLDMPIGGGNETLMKTAHGVNRDVHRVGLGAVARHVSDLADADANDFCLLGGQDGWLGSEGVVDQVPLWLEGRYIRVPMSRSAVADAFPHVTTLAPAAAARKAS